MLLSGTGCERQGTCGNGRLEAGESCDGSDLGGATCRSLGHASGELGCSGGCRFDVSGCEGLVDCGSGVIDSGEQCDGSDLAGATCLSLGLGDGTLACDPVTCQLDISGCEGRGLCGDGVADGDEECDGDDLRGQSCLTVGEVFLGGALSCSPACTLRTSGCYSAPEVPMGEPCEAEGDCGGLLCYPELGGRRSGAPGGMCYERCGEDYGCPLSGEAGVCAVGTGGPSSSAAPISPGRRTTPRAPPPASRATPAWLRTPRASRTSGACRGRRSPIG